MIDGRNGEVMFAKRPGARRAIASTTKLMTALLTLERTRPRQVFRASDYRPAAVESQIGLRPGERMRVADLLKALMLESANDAAETLAEGISGSEAAFVAAMNERAAAARARRHQLRQPDRARRSRQLLHRARPGHADLRPDAAAALRPSRGHARGAAEVRRAPAHGGQPQRPDRPLPVRQRREDGPHHPGRLRAGRLGPQPDRWAGHLRGDGRAQRAGPRRRHAGAAALGARPLPPRSRARSSPAACQAGRRVLRRAERPCPRSGGSC